MARARGETMSSWRPDHVRLVQSEQVKTPSVIVVGESENIEAILSYGYGFDFSP